MTGEPHLWARRSHDRHPGLYEAEYAKQLDRIARIRDTVSAGLPNDETTPPPPESPRADDAPPAGTPRGDAPPAPERPHDDGAPHRWDVAPADLAPPVGGPARPWRRPPGWKRPGVASAGAPAVRTEPSGGMRSREAANTGATTGRRGATVARWVAFVAVVGVLVAAVLLLSRTEPVPAVAGTTFRVPGQPTGIAVAGGRVWVAGPGSGAVWILDAVTGRPAAPALRTGGAPARLAVGPPWAWVADTRRGAIVRVRIDGTGTPRVLSQGPDVTDVVVAAGAVWAASSADGTVRVRTAGGTWRTLRVGSRPLALAADDRRVVAVDAGTGTLVRLSAARRRVVGPPIPLGGAPVDVALDGNEAWVVDSGAGTLQRVDVKLGTAEPPAPVCAAPVAVAANAGNVFVLCRGDRTLVRLDGFTGQVRERTPLQVPPTALFLDDRHVWIAAGEHEVIRVDR
ncbi:hypothetical protein OJ998_02915 [Solirubrobacter taibaiensis]|nr:hypothetical protein [Solirubrobacter taibaiensis]